MHSLRKINKSTMTTPKGRGSDGNISPRDVSTSAPSSSSLNTKAKGARFERQVRKFLEAQGCFVVRQAMSAFPDLLAITDNRRILFIECKVNKYLSQKEKRELLGQQYGEPWVAYPYYEGRRKHIAIRHVRTGKIYIDEIPGRN